MRADHVPLLGFWWLLEPRHMGGPEVDGAPGNHQCNEG